MGGILRLPDLAATLDLYSEKGPEGMAGGPVAAAGRGGIGGPTAACSPPRTSRLTSRRGAHRSPSRPSAGT